MPKVAECAAQPTLVLIKPILKPAVTIQATLTSIHWIETAISSFAAITVAWRAGCHFAIQSHHTVAEAIAIAIIGMSVAALIGSVGSIVFD